MSKETEQQYLDHCKSLYGEQHIIGKVPIFEDNTWRLVRKDSYEYQNHQSAQGQCEVQCVEDVTDCCGDKCADNDDMALKQATTITINGQAVGGSNLYDYKSPPTEHQKMVGSLTKQLITMRDDAQQSIKSDVPVVMSGNAKSGWLFEDISGKHMVAISNEPKEEAWMRQIAGGKNPPIEPEFESQYIREQEWRELKQRFCDLHLTIRTTIGKELGIYQDETVCVSGDDKLTAEGMFNAYSKRSFNSHIYDKFMDVLKDLPKPNNTNPYEQLASDYKSGMINDMNKFRNQQKQQTKSTDVHFPFGYEPGTLGYERFKQQQAIKSDIPVFVSTNGGPVEEAKPKSSPSVLDLLKAEGAKYRTIPMPPEGRLTPEKLRNISRIREGLGDAQYVIPTGANNLFLGEKLRITRKLNQDLIHLVERANGAKFLLEELYCEDGTCRPIPMPKAEKIVKDALVILQEVYKNYMDMQ